jgi:16S rRNA G966 N2-methylase RsmD
MKKIKNGEIVKQKTSTLACGSLHDMNLINKLLNGIRVDMIYCDPPWNNGILTNYRKRAGYVSKDTVSNILDSILLIVQKLKPKVLYLEIGVQNKHLVEEKFKQYNKKCFNITYYGKKPCFLYQIYFINTTGGYDFSNIDDAETPYFAISYEKQHLHIKNVLDICAGTGITGRAAKQNGIYFFGLELNKEKISKLLE